MGTVEEKLVSIRHDMGLRQLRGRGIRDQQVLAAFDEIPRERFIPPEIRDQAYEDRPLPIGCGQTISQPYIVALMVQELDVQSHHNVLDVGAGSGYQTAILAKLAGHVFAVERIEQLTEMAMDALASLSLTNITFCTRDGSVGWPEESPFDRIICGAAAPEVPQAWIDQLSDGGRIIVPVGGREVQTLLRVEKHGQQITRREICGVRFVKLIGRSGWPEE